MHITAINFPKFNQAFGTKNTAAASPIAPAPLQTNTQASSLNVLSFMGMADVNMSQEEPKIKRGKPNSVVEEVDEATHRKQISYFDSEGRLDTYEEFAPHSDTVIDFRDKYKYPEKGVIVMDTYIYSNIFERFVPWEKTTITKDTVAINHIGNSDDGDERRKLKVFDKKTFDQRELPIEKRLKLVSETIYSGEELMKTEILPPEFENDLKCMHKRMVPVMKTEYHDNGKIKKETKFYSKYEHRFPERYEKVYNKNGDLESRVFLDEFNIPYEINLYGKCKPFNVTKPKGSSAKKSSEEVPYEVKISFVTNKTSDTPSRLGSHFSKNDTPTRIISSGVIENIKLAIGTDTSSMARFELQNWFKRGGRTINIKYTTPFDAKLDLIYDPSGTPFSIFNSLIRSREHYDSYLDPNLSKFYKKFDEEICTEQHLWVYKGARLRKRYYINPKTDSPTFYAVEDINDDPFFYKRAQVCEVWKYIKSLQEKYDLKEIRKQYEKRPE